MKDFWQKDFSHAKELAREISDGIKKLDRPSSTFSSATSIGQGGGKGKQTAILRGQLAQLAQEVSHLEQMLMSISSNPSAYDVTPKILLQRREQITLLQQEREDLYATFRSSSGRGTSPFDSSYPSSSSDGFSSSSSATFSSLVGGQKSHMSSVSSPSTTVLTPFTSEGASSVLTSRRTESDGEEYTSMSSNQLLEAQQRMMKGQDDQLEYLEGTVHNLKYIGTTISDEVNLHHRLLSDLDNEVEHARSHLSRNRSLLTRLRHRTNSTTCLVCIIILLLILILFLVVYVS